MHVPVGCYSRNMSCTYLLKVIPETCHARTCWRLFQKHVMHVPVEGYSRNMSCTYLLKVIPETCHARTCWRLFQKHVMHVPDEGYSRNISCTYLMKVIPETRTGFDIYVFILWEWILVASNMRCDEKSIWSKTYLQYVILSRICQNDVSDVDITSG
jgi:hypothetical protein